mmetsp:Transcript_34565/g.73326  ORF Transcript_34565/g.73326 Transcript_34565/m.73326 type:complete len:304 (-) Transcript_34565:2-913(-)
MGGFWRWLLVAAVWAGDVQEVKSQIEYLWPIHLQVLPLAARVKGAEGVESPEFAAKLASIVEKKYQEFIKTELPKEIAADPNYKARFDSDDAGRYNQAFRTWQRRAAATKYRWPVNEIDGLDLLRVPKTQGVQYNFDELYESPEYKAFVRHVERLARAYVKRMDENSAPPKFRIFVWGEVFPKAVATRPHIHTGGYCAGTFFVRQPKGASRFNFEDPRGINPPYGKTHMKQPQQGELILFPGWASHFNSPNSHETTRVELSFVAYHYGGPNQLDWEDDPTGGFVPEKTLKMRIPVEYGGRTEL